MEVSGARRSDSVTRGVLLARLGMALLSSLLPCQPPSLHAQSATTGAISGRVLDESGRPIAAAQIQVTDVAHGHIVNLTSNRNGDLLAPSLQPAEYDLDVSFPGFRTAHFDRVLVGLGGMARIEATLARSTVETRISVTAEPLGDLDDLPVATDALISSPEIVHLPSNGRGWQSFARLTPLVSQGSTSDDAGLLSFRGIAPTQNSSRVDGGDDDQSFNASPHGSGTDSGPETEEEAASEGQSSQGNSGRDFSSGSGSGRRPGAEFTFSQAAVQEFRVSGQSYSALYGHAAGGVITTVSKRGTSTLHGSAFYLVRESAWAAANPFAIATHYDSGSVTSALVKPDDRRQQFGGTIGGPILAKRLPGRLFYFYAVDSQRRSFPAVSSPENPAFYVLTATQHALLGNRGVTPAKVDAALTYLDSLTGSVARRADHTVNFLKIDMQTNPRNQFGIQYNRSRFSSPAGIRSAPVVNRGVRSFGNQDIQIDTVLMRWLYARRVAFSNELRLQYSRDLHSEQPQVPLSQEPAIAPGGLSPEIAIGPQGFNFGTPASVGRRAAPDEHRIQVAEITTLAHGHQLLQTGLDYSYVRDYTDSLSNSSGTFHYDSGTTNGRAGGVVDWITDYTFNVNTYPNGGCPSINSTIHDFCFRSFSQAFGEQTAKFSTQEFAGFFQDRWRVTESLSLTAGLRYEYELLPLPQRPNPAIDEIFSARGATSIFPEDRNNFGPRLAASWAPFGERRGTIRVAYGLYVGRLPGATIRSALIDTGLPSSATRIRILPSAVTGCPQVANQGFGYPCAFIAAPPSGVGATTSITLFDRRFRLPLVQQGAFSMEREVGHFATVSASYLLNLDRQLPNSVDINIAPSAETRSFKIQGGTSTVGVRNGDTFTIPLYTRRVSDRFGPVTAITSSADGTYNALVLQARQRSRGGLEFRASWTWSKSIDFGQNSSSVPRTSGQLDPFQIRYDKAVSDHNIPHKVIASAVWAPKPEFASLIAQHLASGWLLAPVFTESSGRPYSYNIFGGSRLPGGHESINGSGGDLYLPSVGRNTLRLPDTTNLDLRLSRDVPLSEKLHLHAFAEVFNVGNHVNYTATTERAFLTGTAAGGLTPLLYQDAAAIAAEGLNSRPFGTPTSSTAQSAKERQIQLGLQIDF